MGVLIIAIFVNFYEGGKTGSEGAKNIDPIIIFKGRIFFENSYPKKLVDGKQELLF